MKALEECPASGDLRLADDVDCVCARIDHRGTRDADFRSQVTKVAPDMAARYGRFTCSPAMCGIDQVLLPEGCARTGVRVERIQTVTLRGDKDDVVLGGVDGQIPGPEGLRIYGAIDRAREQLSECRGMHDSGGQSVLFGVGSVARRIVVIREDACEVGDA